MNRRNLLIGLLMYPLARIAAKLSPPTNPDPYPPANGRIILDLQPERPKCGGYYYKVTYLNSKGEEIAPQSEVNIY